LEEKGILTEYPKLSAIDLKKRAQVSEQTTQHELDVMDVKATITAAIRGADSFSILEFTTWPKLCQFNASASPAADRKPVKPDGFLRIDETTSNGSFEHTFYLEVDRSHESQEKITDKALCYREHYTSGGLAVRNGSPRSDYREFPFRVLMVFRTTDRRNNANDAMLRLTKPVRTMVWTTTQKELLNDPLGAIWIRPSDYHAVTQGTPFDPDRKRESIYRRQAERERLVEATVIKHPLLQASGAADHSVM
jgi:Replication-relaxation